MREAYDLGVVVPQNLSVIGFDNIRLSEFMIPPLTTVEMSQAEIATAFRALMEDVARGATISGRREYSLNTHLILRSSTAFACAGTLQTRDRRSASTAKSILLGPESRGVKVYDPSNPEFTENSIDNQLE